MQYSRLFLILLEVWQSDTYIYILLFMSTIPKFKYENKDLNELFSWGVARDVEYFLTNLKNNIGPVDDL